MFTIIGWLVIGYIAGSLALWVFPPKVPVPGWQTVAFGVAGSIVGGMVSSTLSGDIYAPGGLIMSAAGACAVVLAVRWYQEQGNG